MKTDKIMKNYVWPFTLCMPKRPPKFVYLDLNHWITLARVVCGHRDGKKDKELLDFCLGAVEEKSAIFPVSLSIYVEIQKIRDHQRRRNLRKTIERLGQYVVVMPRAVVATHEIEAVLDRIVGPNPEPINTMDYLDWGVFRAMGMDGGIRVEANSGEDMTAEYSPIIR